MVITERTTEIYGRRNSECPSEWLASFQWRDHEGIGWAVREGLSPKEIEAVRKEKVRFEKAVKKMIEEFSAP